MGEERIMEERRNETERKKKWRELRWVSEACRAKTGTGSEDRF